MARGNISLKQLQIDKANSTIVISLALASFVIVFSLVGVKALLSQRAYQQRVITEKEQAVTQLKKNTTEVASLVGSYAEFVGSPENVLGGNPAGTGPKDGDNARIILDALPSVYDFPGLTSSIEKVLIENNYKIESITGTDDEVNQKATEVTQSEPIEIPFEFTVKGNYGSMANLVSLLERSIRPIQIRTMEFSGNENDIQATITSRTFYQPEKGLTITTKEVK